MRRVRFIGQIPNPYPAVLAARDQPPSARRERDTQELARALLHDAERSVARKVLQVNLIYARTVGPMSDQGKREPELVRNPQCVRESSHPRRSRELCRLETERRSCSTGPSPAQPAADPPSSCSRGSRAGSPLPPRRPRPSTPLPFQPRFRFCSTNSSSERSRFTDADACGVANLGLQSPDKINDGPSPGWPRGCG